MLDLSKHKIKYYEIKLPDKTVLKIKPIKQSTMMKMYDLQERAEQGDKDVVNEMYEIVLNLFNNNEKNIEFDMEQIEDFLPMELLATFFEDYIKYSFGVVGE